MKLKTFEEIAYQEPKWIKFVLAEHKPKTSVYNVLTKENVYLGQIKWYPSWRCYAFYPANDTIFEKTCLQDINNFIEKLMSERKITS